MPCCRSRSCGSGRRPGARRRRPVGRGDPDDAPRASTSSRSRDRSGSAARTATGALVVADPERLDVDSPGLLRPAAARAGWQRTSLRRARGGSSRAGGRRARSGGCSRRSSCGPTWWFERASGAAARCRELLPSRAEVVTPRGELDDRRVPAGGARRRMVVSRSARGRCPRPRHPGPAARARLVRLVDERRRPRSAGRRRFDERDRSAKQRSGEGRARHADTFDWRHVSVGVITARWRAHQEGRALAHKVRVELGAARSTAKEPADSRDGQERRTRLEARSCAEAAPCPIGGVGAET